jgi:hypothetical protein
MALKKGILDVVGGLRSRLEPHDNQQMKKHNARAMYSYLQGWIEDGFRLIKCLSDMRVVAQVCEELQRGQNVFFPVRSGLMGTI